MFYHHSTCGKYIQQFWPLILSCKKCLEHLSGAEADESKESSLKSGMCLLCARLFACMWEYELLSIVVNILYELEIDVHNFVAGDDVKYIRFL